MLLHSYYIAIYLKYIIRSYSSSKYWKNIFIYLLNLLNANYTLLSQKIGKWFVNSGAYYYE